MPSKNSKIVSEGDPLAYVLAPPPNETEEQRLARLEAEAEAKRISDAIDEELQRQAKELKRAPKPVKILLLGELPAFQWTLRHELWTGADGGGLDSQVKASLVITLLCLTRVLLLILLSIINKENLQHSKVRLLALRLGNANSNFA